MSIIVESSCIHAVDYKPKERILEVSFTSGTTYRYDSVPQEVYDGLLAADSKGRYLRQHIIGSYPAEKLCS